jgi:hypothetical protein
MNNKKAIIKKAVLDQRVLDLAQIKQKKGHKGQKKVKINTKVAEVVSDKLKKKLRHRDLRDLKTKFVKYIMILLLAHVVMLIFTGNVKVNGIPVLKWDIWLNRVML